MNLQWALKPAISEIRTCLAEVHMKYRLIFTEKKTMKK